MNDLIGTKSEGFYSLAFVLGDADHAPGAGQLSERRGDEEADGAGPDHERRLALLRVRLQGRVHRTSERLYHHRCFVGEVLRDPVELGGVGDERAF
jgi:hypothetical protein